MDWINTYNVGSHIQIFFQAIYVSGGREGLFYQSLVHYYPWAGNILAQRAAPTNHCFFLMGFLLLFVFRWILAEGASAVRSKTPYLRLENFMDHFLIGDPLQLGVQITLSWSNYFIYLSFLKTYVILMFYKHHVAISFLCNSRTHAHIYVIIVLYFSVATHGHLDKRKHDIVTSFILDKFINWTR